MSVLEIAQMMEKPSIMKMKNKQPGGVCVSRWSFRINLKAKSQDFQCWLHGVDFLMPYTPNHITYKQNQDCSIEGILYPPSFTIV